MRSEEGWENVVTTLAKAQKVSTPRKSVEMPLLARARGVRLLNHCSSSRGEYFISGDVDGDRYR